MTGFILQDAGGKIFSLTLLSLEEICRAQDAGGVGESVRGGEREREREREEEICRGQEDAGGKISCDRYSYISREI